MGVLVRILAAGVALALVVPAYAGGDDYDGMGDHEEEGPTYFGFVRDTRGSPVPDAQVTLKPKTGDELVLKSNVLGLYRSHLSKRVLPADVEVICGKNGYKQTSVARRPGADNDRHVEVNCVLQRL